VAFTGIAVYFGFINHHSSQSYQLAYNMLSPELQAKQSYADFVAGFATTAHDTVAVESIVPAGDNRWTTTVRLAARQTDGSVRFFRGTYDIAQVPMGGDAPPGTKTERIVGADIGPE
jgi:hypothetical protein